MERTEVDLSIAFDAAGPALPVQIADAVRDLVTSGVLHPGDRLPASRPLADRWGLSRGTVLAGWDQLIAEGYLVSLPGSGTVVNPDLARVHPSGDRPEPQRSSAPRSTPADRRPDRDIIDLRPGRPDVRAVASGDWRRAWRVAVAGPGAEPVDPAGLPRLREQLAGHLRQMRGVLVTPDDLVVTSGARDGLAAVLQVLAARLGRPLRVAVEDPGYPSLHQVPRQLGATVLPVPVDDQGLLVTELPAGAPPDIVLVTPSHQYPLGASMTVTRRLELLDWARRTDAIVVEDDYDSELRYVGAPLPALAALDRRQHPGGDRVVTLGSFSKTVTPELGAGFLLLPERLRPAVIEFRSVIGPALSAVVQRALAEYLAGGGLRRHTQRMRRDYRRRRRIVTDTLDSAPGVIVRAMDGGLAAVIEWPADSTVRDTADRERSVSAELAASGILLGSLSTYWSSAAGRPHYGLVIGYAGVDDDVLRSGLLRIRRAVQRCSSPSTTDVC